MRRAVIDLGKLGTLPASELGVREPEIIHKYQDLIAAIEAPVTDDEARILVKVFGPDDCFGLAWSVLHLVESAPGWPLADCLQDVDNEWIHTLRRRSENAEGHLQGNK